MLKAPFQLECAQKTWVYKIPCKEKHNSAVVTWIQYWSDMAKDKKNLWDSFLMKISSQVVTVKNKVVRYVSSTPPKEK